MPLDILLAGYKIMRGTRTQSTNGGMMSARSSRPSPSTSGASAGPSTSSLKLPTDVRVEEDEHREGRFHLFTKDVSGRGGRAPIPSILGDDDAAPSTRH